MGVTCTVVTRVAVTGGGWIVTTEGTVTPGPCAPGVLPAVLRAVADGLGFGVIGFALCRSGTLMLSELQEYSSRSPATSFWAAGLSWSS